MPTMDIDPSAIEEKQSDAGQVEFETWLKQQPAAVQQAYEAHSHKLTKALDEERARARDGAKAAKRLAEFEAAEQKRQEAELSEIDKLKKQYASLQDELAAERRNQLKQRIAKEVGLPEALALRIQGDDEEALMQDAKALAAALPKEPEAKQDPTKPKPRVLPTNPTGYQPMGETDEQRRARIYGTGTNLFDPARNTSRGGGVVNLKDGNQGN